MIVKRGLAFLIDYVLIISYAVCLYFVSSFLQSFISIDLSSETPLVNQGIGFVTLTLPVFLYFYFSERSAKAATLGKQILGLRVQVQKDISSQKILKRNIVKFLPWEVAHFGVHFLFYFDHKQLSVPIWNWFFLMVPQIMVIFYIITILISRGRSGFYDRLAHTEIVYKSR